MNPPGFEKQAIAADVRVSHPISTPSNKITRSQAQSFDKGSIAARKSLNEKNRKYKEKCDKVGIGFYAIIFESTGRPLLETIQFIETLVKNSVAVKGLDGQATVRYWMSALSFAIQNAISDAILKRALLINSAQSLHAHSKDRSSHHMHMADRINGRHHFRSTTFHSSSSNSHKSKFNNSRFPVYEDNSLVILSPPSIYNSCYLHRVSQYIHGSQEENVEDVEVNSYKLNDLDD